MTSTSTFLGKCWTLLIGGALSWVTVMNPGVGELADGLLGASHTRQQQPPIARSIQSGSESETDSELQPDPFSPEVRMAQISSRLRELGASYLLVERLGGAQKELFRVRCDIATAENPIKCCLESIGADVIDTMEEVLSAVIRLDRNRSARPAEQTGAQLVTSSS